MSTLAKEILKKFPKYEDAQLEAERLARSKNDDWEKGVTTYTFFDNSYIEDQSGELTAKIRRSR